MKTQQKSMHSNKMYEYDNHGESQFATLFIKLFHSLSNKIILEHILLKNNIYLFYL